MVDSSTGTFYGTFYATLNITLTNNLGTNGTPYYKACVTDETELWFLTGVKRRLDSNTEAMIASSSASSVFKDKESLSLNTEEALAAKYRNRSDF